MSRQYRLSDFGKSRSRLKKEIGKVKRLSSKTYRRTKKAVKMTMSARNKKILRYAQNGTTEKELIEKLNLSPKTARVELKWLEGLGFLK